MFQTYIIYQNGDYVETVINQINGTRIVDCSELGINKLYRIEYGDNFSSHKVAYTPEDSYEEFCKHI